MDPVTIPALSVLARYLGSCLPNVARAKLASWTAAQESHAKQIEAQGTVEATKTMFEGLSESLPALLEDGNAISGILDNADVSISSNIEVAESISHSVNIQIDRKQSNTGTIFSKAADVLQDKEVGNHEPDPSWTSPFSNHAQDISADELQDLWAEILAGEVVQPGSTSHRTLSILKDMDVNVAKVFEQLCSLCVIVPGDGKQYLDARVPSLGGRASANALQPYGLSFDSLNLLCEYGLIITDFDSWYPYTNCSRVPNTGDIAVRIPFLFRKRYWVLSPIRGRQYSDEFKVNGVALTRAGRELSRVVSPTTNDAYARAFEQFVDKSNFSMVEVPNGEPQAFVPDQG